MAGYTYTIDAPKDPDALLDYPLDWTGWLADAADTIVASTWEVADGTVIIDSGRTSFNSSGTIVWLSGGIAGETVIVTNHIVTAGGRHDDRSLRIKIKDR